MWSLLPNNESAPIMKLTKKMLDVRESNTETETVALPFTPMLELEHLLKVAGSVTNDANKVWADIWTEFKKISTSSGMITPDAKEGFIPSCGWPEFLEKFWMLKHYLDSVQRICEKKH